MIPAKANQPVPNKYFLLEGGDIVMRSDEFYNPVTNKWEPVGNGHSVPLAGSIYAAIEDVPIRRKNTGFIAAYMGQWGVPANCVTEGTNFDIRITRREAERLLQDQLRGGDQRFKQYPFDIMCKEYGDDEDWNSMTADDLIEGKLDDEYQTFEIFLPL